MMKLPLHRHPASHSPVSRIEVELFRQASGLLRLTYRIFGALDRVAIPHAQASARADGLWKHSCFEAFLGARDGYYELNFSPSAQWAAYRFDDYRAGMRAAAMPGPAVAWSADGGEGRLSAAIDLPADVTGPLGLSAVIEDKDGGRSFWALAHPPGQPDFHQAACFAAELPPAS